MQVFYRFYFWIVLHSKSIERKKVLSTFLLAGHFLACFWVAIGRAGDKAGKQNWLEKIDVGNSKGFTYHDTSGGPRASSVYISAYYFVLTVMTSEYFP
jgi:hypothetical protein